MSESKLGCVTASLLLGFALGVIVYAPFTLFGLLVRFFAVVMLATWLLPPLIQKVKWDNDTR